MNKKVDMTIDLTEEAKMSHVDSTFFKELKQVFKSWKLLRTVFIAKPYLYCLNYTALDYGGCKIGLRFDYAFVCENIKKIDVNHLVLLDVHLRRLLWFDFKCKIHVWKYFH